MKFLGLWLVYAYMVTHIYIYSISFPSLPLSLSSPLPPSSLPSFPLSLQLSLTHSLTLSFTHSLPLSPTLSLTHSFTHSLTLSFSHSLTHSLTPSPSCPLTHSLIHSLIHSLPSLPVRVPVTPCMWWRCFSAARPNPVKMHPKRLPSHLLLETRGRCK